MKTLITTCLLAITTTLLLAAEPLRILCVGDSITQGGKADRQEYTYRLPLQRLLQEAGVAYDFIGSRTQGLQKEATWPDVAESVPFDPHHEGYYGNKTADVVAKLIAAWPADSPAPDIVLVHLGTNDQNAPNKAEAVWQPLEKLIAFLREKNPKVVVLLGYLNFNDSAGAFRVMAEIAEVAKAQNQKESPIKTVKHYQGWQENPKAENADTFDWAHPNLSGQQKMADNWFAAMQPFL